MSKHVREIAIGGNQRLGLFKRTGRVIRTTKGRTTVYKGFVRSKMEYCPLVWMAAPRTCLAKLDNIQHRAAAFCGQGVVLDPLKHRRKVAALSYLFKLQCISGPSCLTTIVPDKLPRPRVGRTRAEQNQYASWHSYKLLCPLDHRSPEYMRRAFPYCVITDWNNIPPSFFDAGIGIEGLQSFKKKVHHFLLDSPQ